MLPDQKCESAENGVTLSRAPPLPFYCYLFFLHPSAPFGTQYWKRIEGNKCEERKKKKNGRGKK